ncbi:MULTISPECIES: TRAP transporter substrate-binding protein [Marivita]|jgi:TRAP-type C4-dicarboxylate transport system substrate-binding protein|uniref:TRAP transporter substrate-binding protein n=1 Tax=Marivita cryptomonadis TaxID=505252 RepID=A0A9Q2S713_9RHOB|nr:MULTISPECIES: TRAP transporter substrate-binding protein [Marivita]MCR9168379.1 TRAP transporter substrate-binding protein [Paracoccaceae bacterium]MBM2323714.1 TRAP transporter substrate-binding protein [Marivita cryptomonadis]MBM2333302.1 TRAP transporter substrate-binding protein [Marivita cryptomonadis]MBM2342880.1 TRAP transporter substrate-binding protein [Marivita cryptomonadis]MBM2347550.1 TRAP transporter substrate-binding protein [Marivita cryptomonadis]
MKNGLSRRQLMATAAAALAAGIAPRAAMAATVLRYGNAGGPQSLSNTFNATLSDTLSERTNGELSFEIFAGTLGGEKDLIESMALGALDIYNGAYTGTDQFDVMYSPYFFKDGVHAKQVLESDIGATASKVLEDKYNARLLGAGRLGGYNLMLKEPIESLADLKGRKVRAPQIKGCIEALSFFGAVPTPIPFNEVYLSLQSGIVDGVLTALNPAVQFKFYEVCANVVVPDFGLALDKEVISVAAWDALGEEKQMILQDTFNELEEEAYFKAGLASKSVDLAAWAAANGDAALIDLDASGLATDIAPLNERMANEAFGDGSWAKMQEMSA